jgi:3-aminobutyryl-CoA ammonia-lyase
MTNEHTSLIRVRIAAHDAHYAGGLVDGAKVLGLFGDVATELLIRSDGDEGLFVAYDNVQFLAPVKAGDFIEARGRITSTGKSSRKMQFEAWRVIESAGFAARPSAANLLSEPVLVCKASGTCVVPLESQRGPGGRKQMQA